MKEFPNIFPICQKVIKFFQNINIFPFIIAQLAGGVFLGYRQCNRRSSCGSDEAADHQQIIGRPCQPVKNEGEGDYASDEGVQEDHVNRGSAYL